MSVCQGSEDRHERNPDGAAADMDAECPADQLRETVRADPTVEDVELVAEYEEKDLYRMKWGDDIQLVLQMITNSEATILDGIGSNEGWRFRVFYPDRDLFAKTIGFCDDHGIAFDVSSIREVDRSSAGRYGLTSAQRDALTKATRRGHFSVPRESTVEEVAEEIGVSHQALSERLRRATESLIESTLLYEYGGDTPQRDEVESQDREASVS